GHQTTAPTITICPQPVTNSADATCQAQVPIFTNAVVATDNCTPATALLITQRPLAGTTVGLGTTNVTICVVDQAGNTNKCYTSFTVVDTTPPTVACPVATTNSADANCQAAI